MRGLTVRLFCLLCLLGSCFGSVVGVVGGFSAHCRCSSPLDGCCAGHAGNCSFIQCALSLVQVHPGCRPIFCRFVGVPGWRWCWLMLVVVRAPSYSSVSASMAGRSGIYAQRIGTSTASAGMTYCVGQVQGQRTVYRLQTTDGSMLLE